MKTTIAVFPGSFDPLTVGHVDIITRALEIFEHVIVAVLHNPSKTALFSTEERLLLIREQFMDQKERVSVASFSGLLVDFCREHKSRVIVRGLRAISDYDYETQMALMNKSLSEEIETVFLAARERYSYVSSSLVKQVAPYGGNVSNIVPPIIDRAIKVKLKLP